MKKSCTCISTTSRRTPSGKFARCAARAAARSGTARWPSARCIPVLPPTEEFPYAMLLQSEVLESNGSTSMASVCGSTLALMDAGVQIKAPVAGVAMGLMTIGDQFAVLTDIQGMEDFSGDMDFKVAGTTRGHHRHPDGHQDPGHPARGDGAGAGAGAAGTAPYPRQDRRSDRRAARQKLSEYAPSIFTIEINPERIGEVIGPGGKMIKKITAETGAQIDIQQDGKIYIAAVDQAAGKRAADIILGMVGEIEVGTVFTGKVTRLIGMGAFVEIAPGREGLVHVSHLRVPPVRRPEEAVKLGDEIKVRVIEVDSQGRINLSAINLDQPFDASMAKRPDDGRGGGGGRLAAEIGRRSRRAASAEAEIAAVTGDAAGIVTDARTAAPPPTPSEEEEGDDCPKRVSDRDVKFRFEKSL